MNGAGHVLDADVFVAVGGAANAVAEAQAHDHEDVGIETTRDSSRLSPKPQAG
jgi:hypothetical protein